MIFNLNEKCLNSKKKEFYYGAKLNKNIKDVYLGVGFLEGGEKDLKIGPGRGHEEILYIVKGKAEVKFKDSQYLLNEGELIFLPDNLKARLSNLTRERCQFVIAGGHTKFHGH